MLNWQEGHGVTELNYPHIIDIWGYERHHDVATRSGKKRGGTRSRRTQQVLSNRKAGTNRAKPKAHSQGKQGQSKGKNRLNVLKG